MATQFGQIFVDISVNLTKFANSLKQATTTAQSAGKDLEQALSEGPKRGIKDVEKQVEESTQNMGKAFKDVSRIAQGIIVSQVFYRTVDAIKESIKALFEFQQELEQAQLAFGTMMGSDYEASRFIQALKDFSTRTPFTFQQLEVGAKRLEAFGFQAKSVIPILTVLGDAASGLGGDMETFNGIVHAIGQINTVGVVQERELMELAMHGVPAYQILQQQLGLTAHQVHNIGKEAIPANVAIRALLNGMEQRFPKLMDKMSDTTHGMITTIQDNLKLLGTSLTEGMFNNIKSGLRSFRDTLDTLRKELDAGGLGNVFEHLVPANLRPTIRVIIGSFESLWTSIKKIAVVVGDVAKAFGGALLGALSVILPIIAMLGRVLGELADWMDKHRIAVEALAYTIFSLKIAELAAIWTTKLVAAIRALAFAEVAAQAVLKLRNAIQATLLVLTRNPIVFVISIIGAALLGLALSSKNASDWLEHLMTRLGQLAGFNMGEILQPTDPKQLGDYMKDYNGNLQDIMKNMGGTADAADKAKKANDKFLASFDEVFEVKEKMGAGSGSGGQDFLFPVPGNIPGGPNPPTDGGFGSGGSGNFDKLPLFPAAINLPKLEWPPGPPGPPAAVADDLLATINSMIDNLKAKAPVFEATMQMLFLPFEIGSSIASGIMANNMQVAMQGIKNAILGNNPTVQAAWDSVLSPLELKVKQFVTNTGIDWSGLGVNLQTSLLSTGTILKATWDGILNGLQLSMQTKDGVTEISWGAFLNNLLLQLQITSTQLDSTWGQAFNNMQIQLAPVINAIEVVWYTFLGNLQAGWEIQKAQLEDSWDSFKQSVNNTVLNLVTQVQTTWSGIKDAILAPFNKMWDDFKLTLSHFWENTKQTFQHGVDVVKGIWENHKIAVIGVVGGLIIAVVLLFTGLPAAVVAAIGGLIEAIAPIFEAIAPAVEGWIANVPGLFSGMVDGIVGWVETIIPRTGSILSEIPTMVKNILSEAETTVSNFISSVGSRVSNAVGNAISSAGSAITNAANNMVKTITHGNAVPANVTGFAGGAIIGRDSIVRVGEGGRREAIVPLQDGSAMAPFAAAVANHLAQMATGGNNSSGGDTFNIGTLIADDRSLKDLERRLRVIRNGETTRGANA